MRESTTVTPEKRVEPSWTASSHSSSESGPKVDHRKWSRPSSKSPSSNPWRSYAHESSRNGVEPASADAVGASNQLIAQTADSPVPRMPARAPGGRRRAAQANGLANRCRSPSWCSDRSGRCGVMLRPPGMRGAPCRCCDGRRQDRPRAGVRSCRRPDRLMSRGGRGRGRRAGEPARGCRNARTPRARSVAWCLARAGCTPEELDGVAVVPAPGPGADLPRRIAACDRTVVGQLHALAVAVFHGTGRPAAAVLVVDRQARRALLARGDGARVEVLDEVPQRPRCRSWRPRRAGAQGAPSSGSGEASRTTARRCGCCARPTGSARSSYTPVGDGCAAAAAVLARGGRVGWLQGLPSSAGCRWATAPCSPRATG